MTEQGRGGAIRCVRTMWLRHSATSHTDEAVSNRVEIGEADEPSSSTKARPGICSILDHLCL